MNWILATPSAVTQEFDNFLSTIYIYIYIYCNIISSSFWISCLFWRLSM